MANFSFRNSQDVNWSDTTDVAWEAPLCLLNAECNISANTGDVVVSVLRFLLIECPVVIQTTEVSLLNITLLRVLCLVSCASSEIILLNKQVIPANCSTTIISSDIEAAVYRTEVVVCSSDVSTSSPHINIIDCIYPVCNTRTETTIPNISVIHSLTTNSLTNSLSSLVLLKVAKSISTSVEINTATSEIAEIVVRTQIHATCESVTETSGPSISILTTIAAYTYTNAQVSDVSVANFIKLPTSSSINTNTTEIDLYNPIGSIDRLFSVACIADTTTSYVAVERTDYLLASCNVGSYSSAAALLTLRVLGVVAATEIITSSIRIKAKTNVAGGTVVNATTLTSTGFAELINKCLFEFACAVETNTSPISILSAANLVASCSVQTATPFIVLQRNDLLRASGVINVSTATADLSTTLSVHATSETNVDTSTANLRTSSNKELSASCVTIVDTSLLHVDSVSSIQLVSSISTVISTSAFVPDISMAISAECAIECISSGIDVVLSNGFYATCSAVTETGVSNVGITNYIRVNGSSNTSTSNALLAVLQIFDASCDILVETNAWHITVSAGLIEPVVTCLISTSTSNILNFSWANFPNANDCQFHNVSDTVGLLDVTDVLSLLDETDKLTLNIN